MVLEDVDVLVEVEVVVEVDVLVEVEVVVEVDVLVEVEVVVEVEVLVEVEVVVEVEVLVVEVDSLFWLYCETIIVDTINPTITTNPTAVIIYFFSIFLIQFQNIKNICKNSRDY